MSEQMKEIRAAQITMGRGLVDVSRIEHEGRAGILFRPRTIHIPVGEPGELPPGEYWPVDGDVVIWIENEGGAKVVQTHLAPFLPAPVAWLRPGEYLPIQNCPFGAMWISDKDDPRAFPVYAATQAEAAPLFGPYAYLNGPRALPEDSWSVEDDPIENNEEYFSVPLFAKFDVTFPVTHAAPDAAAHQAYAEALRADALKSTGASPPTGLALDKEPRDG